MAAPWFKGKTMPVRHRAVTSSLVLIGAVAIASGVSASGWRTSNVEQAVPAAQSSRGPDVIYVPTPEAVVDKMLEMAKVTSADVVYDLGCGDGRIPIAAVQKYGARGVGIDIDPQRILEANANARKAAVLGKVKFLQADLFTTDISEATVVTLYLLPTLNVKLMPKLMAELKPGTRIVSHAFAMGDSWPPEQTASVDGRNIYFWTIPAKR
jgi:SAM-dependent methyltransferase